MVGELLFVGDLFVGGTFASQCCQHKDALEFGA
jgi:hypothetical protein